MPGGADDQREDVAAAARAFSRLGYVHAFGHVSLRLEDSEKLLITPTRPVLARQTGADLLEVDFDGRVVRGDAAARPIEVFLHIGIYAAGAEARAICRTHAPYASAWVGGADEVPRVLHGFGGMVGNVATFEERDLIHNAAMGARAAKALGGAGALMLLGNGVLTVGRTVGEAAARMWSLEERCAQAARQRMLHGAGPEAQAVAFSANDLAARGQWYPAEAERIWNWLKYLGSSETPRGGGA